MRLHVISICNATLQAQAVHSNIFFNLLTRVEYHCMGSTLDKVRLRGAPKLNIMYMHQVWMSAYGCTISKVYNQFRLHNDSQLPCALYPYIPN